MRSLLSLRRAHRAAADASTGNGQGVGLRGGLVAPVGARVVYRLRAGHGWINARGLVLRTVCALAAALALSSDPAGAIETHVFSSSFGSAGSGAGQMSSPVGVAVNSVTHDAYVVDRGNLRIDEFSPSGAFVRAWGWGVADGLPKFETCTLVCQAGISGGGGGQFRTPGWIAVDNSTGASAGDVYVGDVGDDSVSKFDASGDLISGWGTSGQLDGSTAADRVGFGAEIMHFAFAAPGEVAEAGGSTCGFEGESGGCLPTDSFGFGTLAPIEGQAEAVPAGVALDSGRVYAADAPGDRIDIFTPAALAEVKTEAPAPVAKTIALLHATVNPDGIEVSSCQFEWGTELKVYPNTVACSTSPGSGSAPVSVSAELTGLTASTHYFYRIAAASAGGVNHGQGQPLVTSMR